MRIFYYRYYAIATSLVLGVVLFALTYGWHSGFASSLTFDGGLRLVVQLPEQYGAEQIVQAMEREKLPQPQTRLSNARLNIWDLEFDETLKQTLASSLNSPKDEDLLSEISSRLVQGLDLAINQDDIIASEILSSSYGKNLFALSIKILLYTIIGIGAYLTFRFSFAFSVGAIVALFHDLILALGFIGAMQIKPSIPIVAAVLTLLGYSINDTIVIFDRIREARSDRDLSVQMIDLSIVQTLSRTIVTAILTLLSVLSLWLSGNSELQDFALVMFWGVIVGTYSSIFIAAPITYKFQEIQSFRSS